jgi:hypothetical protein
VHTVHISGHAVSSSTLNRQLGWAALSARSAGRGSASASLFGIVVVGGDVCAPPASVPVMAVQVRGPSAVWMQRAALAPSPTAEATRFSEVSRTSPAANTVGMLVSTAVWAPQSCAGGAEFFGVGRRGLPRFAGSLDLSSRGPGLEGAEDVTSSSSLMVFERLAR